MGDGRWEIDWSGLQPSSIWGDPNLGLAPQAMVMEGRWPSWRCGSLVAAEGTRRTSRLRAWVPMKPGVGFDAPGIRLLAAAATSGPSRHFQPAHRSG